MSSRGKDAVEVVLTDGPISHELASPPVIIGTRRFTGPRWWSAVDHVAPSLLDGHRRVTRHGVSVVVAEADLPVVAVAGIIRPPVLADCNWSPAISRGSVHTGGSGRAWRGLDTLGRGR